MSGPGLSAPRRLLELVLPGRCQACRGAAADAALCPGCAMRLRQGEPVRGAPPPGLDAIHSAHLHQGPARDLVGALKFGRQLAVAELIGAEIARTVSRSTLVGPLVPVPAAPWRSRMRGLDPPREIARAIAGADRSAPGAVHCLARRGEARQVGRGRGARRAAGFRVEAVAPVPPRCVLVDDVCTTGGTLSVCAAELRRQGAVAVTAVTFTRRI